MTQATLPPRATPDEAPRAVRDTRLLALLAAVLLVGVGIAAGAYQVADSPGLAQLTTLIGAVAAIPFVLAAAALRSRRDELAMGLSAGLGSLLLVWLPVLLVASVVG